MLTYELISQLATALMQEADIDLNKEVETYSKSLEYPDSGEHANKNEDDEDDDFGIDDPDLQGDVEEALTCALETFFSTLSESAQEEIKQAIGRFAICPGAEDLVNWKLAERPYRPGMYEHLKLQ